MEIPVDAMIRLCEQNAARFLALDKNSIAIRYELEQKRRGFSLLSELSVSLRQDTGYENVFIPVSKRINAALNMQRTVFLVRDDAGRFGAEVLQGYSASEKAGLAGKHIEVPAELLDPDVPVMVTGADPPGKLDALRELLGLPYFVSSPVIVQGDTYGVLLAGRLVEAEPYLVRLSRSDMETVHAISALLASVFAGQRLAAAEERNRVMVDASPMCCVFWDENGNLSDCNNATLSMFGLPSTEEFLSRFNDLSPEFQSDGSHSESTVRECIRKAYVSGETMKLNWTHKTLDDELIPAEVTLTRVPQGDKYFVAGYIRDLREQEAAQAKVDEAREAAERYMKSKNEFLASVSHEIRTPLNAIAAMARIACEAKDITDSQQNLVKQGMYSVELLASAIETILDFSQLDSGQLSLEIGEFSIRGLMNEIDEMAGREAAEKSLHFNSSVDADLPDSLIGDPVRLLQIIQNIVMNAVKFTEKGGVDVSVRHENAADDMAMVMFEVRDTGIGITDEQMSKLLNPLYTGDASYTRKHGGMGMGLAVSNSLAKLMGGGITCESKPGEGSVFRIALPLTMKRESIVEAEAEAPAPYADILSGLRVLVAEDNNINQMIMEDMLRSVGVEVTLASNGLEALARLREGDFDIVLMDIQMPEMDGLTATAQIRADHSHDSLPILAVTANAGKEHFEESINAGMNGFLTKPVNMEQMYSALAKWSGRR